MYTSTTRTCLSHATAAWKPVERLRLSSDCVSCYFAPSTRAVQGIAMSTSVCLSAHISQKPHADELYPVFVHDAYGHDSVFVWRRCDKLCTSGFGAGTSCFTQWALWRDMCTANGDRTRDRNNGQEHNQILLNDKDQQVVVVSCALGAKSVIYDCPV